MNIPYVDSYVNVRKGSEYRSSYEKVLLGDRPEVHPELFHYSSYSYPFYSLSTRSYIIRPPLSSVVTN